MIDESFGCLESEIVVLEAVEWPFRLGWTWYKEFILTVKCFAEADAVRFPGLADHELNLSYRAILGVTSEQQQQ